LACGCGWLDFDGQALACPFLFLNVFKRVTTRILDKELGYTQKEFLLTLNCQTTFLAFKVFEGGVEIKFPPGSVHVYFLEEAQRRIASMRLPLLRVRMELFSLDEEQEKLFFNQFLRAFQKGGG
jgi:hypothetical protein